VAPGRLARDHQVLAWAYAIDDHAIRLRVYDPNHPGRDDVELRATTADGGRMEQSTGEPLLGWFRGPYPPPRTIRAWR
jgi:hypothetical protein